MGSAISSWGDSDPVTHSCEALVSPATNITCILHRGQSEVRGDLYTKCNQSAGTGSAWHSELLSRPGDQCRSERLLLWRPHLRVTCLYPALSDGLRVNQHRVLMQSCSCQTSGLKPTRTAFKTWVCWISVTRQVLCLLRFHHPLVCRHRVPCPEVGVCLALIKWWVFALLS